MSEPHPFSIFEARRKGTHYINSLKFKYLNNYITQSRVNYSSSAVHADNLQQHCTTNKTCINGILEDLRAKRRASVGGERAYITHATTRLNSIRPCAIVTRSGTREKIKMQNKTRFFFVVR